MLHEFNLPADKEKINFKENSTDSILDIILLLPLLIIVYTDVDIYREINRTFIEIYYIF